MGAEGHGVAEERQHEPGAHDFGEPLGTALDWGGRPGRGAEERQRLRHQRLDQHQADVERHEALDAEAGDDHAAGADRQHVADGGARAERPEVGAVAAGHPHGGGVEHWTDGLVRRHREGPDREDSPEGVDEEQRHRHRALDRRGGDDGLAPVAGAVGDAADGEVERDHHQHRRDVDHSDLPGIKAVLGEPDAGADHRGAERGHQEEVAERDPALGAGCEQGLDGGGHASARAPPAVHAAATMWAVLRKASAITVSTGLKPPLVG